MAGEVMTEERWRHIMLWALYKLEELRLKGYVCRDEGSQVLTDKGIEEAIRLGDPQATDEELQAAVLLFSRAPGVEAAK